MSPTCLPLRWESTGDQWWYASPIDWAAANGHYDLVRELLYLDTNLLFKLTSLRRIRRLETVWDDDEQFNDAAKCRSQVARKLLMECENKKGHNSLVRAGYGGWLLYTAASAGDMRFVKDLLERDQLLVFGEGEYGVTDILYAAARSKSSEVFRLLLDCCFAKNGGGELEGKEEETPSVFKWEMMNRAVHAAARGGNVNILKELLENCSDILVYRDTQGSTLLHAASARGQIDAVKYLVESYDIINSVDKQGNTALHVAAYRGYLAVVQVLIFRNPSSTSLTNNSGDTFLHLSVAGFRAPGFHRLDRQLELVKELVCGTLTNIEHIVNAKNNVGRTALHMAVTENMHSDLMELLMNVPGINLNIRDTDGMTPLGLLKRRPKSASSEVLIKRLISAGGITNSRDRLTRSALVSHLRIQGMGSSPGTSFRVSDAEIVFYVDAKNVNTTNLDAQSTDYDTCSGELSRFDSLDKPNSSGNKRFGSVNSAANHLKILLQWPKKKERKDDDNSNMEDVDSLDSFSINGASKYSHFSLRQKYAKHSSLPNNKRILSFKSILPSPSTKKKFTSGLMQGVLQVTPKSSVKSPSSRLSESTRSSPISNHKHDGDDSGNDGVGPSDSHSSVNKGKTQTNSMFNKRLMNKYFSFGAQCHDPLNLGG